MGTENTAQENESAQLWRELPLDVLLFLVRAVPPRALWKWLCEDDQSLLLHQVSAGFQRQASALRQNVVRSRLAHHLAAHPETGQSVLQLWRQSKPPVLQAVLSLTTDDELIAHLGELWQQHGGEALVLALLADERTAALEALDGLTDELEAQAEVSENQPDEPTANHAEAEEVQQPAPREPDWAAQIETLTGQLATARAQQAKFKEKAARAEAKWRTEQEKQQSQQHQHQAEVKALTRRAETAEAKLHESEKLLDRTARKLRHEQKIGEEASMENKRSKRQLRRQQEISEELRKQLSQVSQRLERLLAAQQPAAPPNPTPAPSNGVVKKPAAPRPRTVVSPLDQPFCWKADGRLFRITPREVEQAVNSNDEEFVFCLLQAFDALRESNEAHYLKLLEVLRDRNRYYSRVLTVDTTRVLVDASNVARYEKDARGKGRLKNLLTLRDEMRRRDCFPVRLIADASLPYFIDERDELIALARRGEVEFTPSGQEADEVLAREARRSGAYVVTNDRNFHLKVAPDFEPPRISFRIYDGTVIIDEF